MNRLLAAFLDPILRRKLRRAVAGFVLAGSALSAPALAAPPLEPLQHPALERFDPAIREQLTAERAYLDSLLATSGREAELGEALRQIGELYQAYELVDLAGACYRNALRLLPEDFEARYYLAIVEHRLGDLEAAAATLDAALRIRTDAPTLLRRGRVELELGRPEPAVPFLERALTADRQCAGARFWLAEAKRALGDLEGARVLLVAALDADPGAVRAHYPLADVLRRLGDLEAARKHLELSQQPVPPGSDGLPSCPDPLDDQLMFLTTGAPIHLLRGRQAGQEGRLLEELTEYRRAVELAPDEPLARQSLGSALARSGELEAALAEYREAARLEPGSADLQLDVGVLAQRLGRLESARASFEEALRLRPGDLRTLRLLADLSAMLRDFAAAVARYDELLEELPEDPDVRQRRAFALLGAGRAAEARSELGVVLDRWPPADPAARLELAWAVAALGDPVRAEHHLRRVAEGKGEAHLRAQAYLRLAAIAEGRGALDVAVGHLRRVVELDPDQAEARARLEALSRSTSR